MSKPIQPLDWSHAAAAIPAGGRSFSQVATPDECASLASALGLLGVKRLEASYAIKPMGKGRYRLEGPLTAEVTQACVVSLKPVDAALTLPLDLDFCPDTAGDNLPADQEIEVSELPEVAPIEHGRLAVGEIAFETLAAGLDPFPRADGAAFEWLDPRDTAAKPNPFAVLGKLKGPRDSGEET